MKKYMQISFRVALLGTMCGWLVLSALFVGCKPMADEGVENGSDVNSQNSAESSTANGSEEEVNLGTGWDANLQTKEDLKEGTESSEKEKLLDVDAPGVDVEITRSEEGGQVDVEVDPEK